MPEGMKSKKRSYERLAQFAALRNDKFIALLEADLTQRRVLQQILAQLSDMNDRQKKQAIFRVWSKGSPLGVGLQELVIGLTTHFPSLSIEDLTLGALRLLELYGTTHFSTAEEFSAGVLMFLPELEGRNLSAMSAADGRNGSGSGGAAGSSPNSLSEALSQVIIRTATTANQPLDVQDSLLMVDGSAKEALESSLKARFAALDSSAPFQRLKRLLHADGGGMVRGRVATEALRRALEKILRVPPSAAPLLFGAAPEVERDLTDSQSRWSILDAFLSAESARPLLPLASLLRTTSILAGVPIQEELMPAMAQLLEAGDRGMPGTSRPDLDQAQDLTLENLLRATATDRRESESASATSRTDGSGSESETAEALLRDGRLHALFHLWDRDGDRQIGLLDLVIGLRKITENPVKAAAGITASAAGGGGPNGRDLGQLVSDAARFLLAFDAEGSLRWDKETFARFIRAWCANLGLVFSQVADALLNLTYMQRVAEGEKLTLQTVVPQVEMLLAAKKAEAAAHLPSGSAAGVGTRGDVMAGSD